MNSREMRDHCGGGAPSRRALPALIFGWAAFAATAACSPKTPDAPLTPEAAAQKSLVQRGKQVYQTQCTACHNSDPRQKGSLGPDVWGSSKELLTARIVEAKYPPGYTPKKAGAGMPPLPHLKPEIDAIHAYLNAP